MTITIPLVHRVFGITLAKGRTIRRLLVCQVLPFCLMILPLIAIIRAVCGGFSLTSCMVCALSLLLASVAGLLLIHLGDWLDWHLPLIPCPCCGEQPRMLRSETTVYCPNFCRIIPNRISPYKWNEWCLRYEEIRDRKCETCGEKPRIDYRPEDGITLGVACACTETDPCGSTSLVEMLDTHLRQTSGQHNAARAKQMRKLFAERNGYVRRTTPTQPFDTCATDTIPRPPVPRVQSLFAVISGHAANRKDNH